MADKHVAHGSKGQIQIQSQVLHPPRSAQTSKHPRPNIQETKGPRPTHANGIIQSEAWTTRPRSVYRNNADECAMRPQLSAAKRHVRGPSRLEPCSVLPTGPVICGRDTQRAPTSGSTPLYSGLLGSQRTFWHK